MRNNTPVVNTFVNRVQRFASVHRLFVTGGKYIIALSGGADSVCLLMVLKEMATDHNISIEAAHCNFHLRGDESTRDEEFCKKLCSRLNVPFHIAHFDTYAYAELHHVSIEMAARDLRYSYFEQLRQDIDAEAICVAHHRDDSVETVLLNLVRGTGLRGLRGIQPQNGHIIRPLLSVSRIEILSYLEFLHQDYVVDSSNLKNDVKRNKVRLDILPMLQKLNPSVSQSVFESSLRIAEAVKVYDAAIEKSISEVTSALPLNILCIHLSKLKEQPSAECTLHEILVRYGYTSAQIQQVYDSLDKIETGRVFCSRTHELVFDRGNILIKAKSTLIDYPHSIRIPETGIYVFDSEKKLKVEIEKCDNGYMPSRQPDCVCVDAAELKFPLILRHLKNADRFVPFGMNKMKLISDYLTDCKKNIFEKREQLVVEDASGRIVWLVGERADNRYRITSYSRNAVRLTVFRVE